MSVEFPRPLRLERIGAAGLDITVTAGPAECETLAARMNLPAIASLSCRFRLRPGPAGCIEARGNLTAKITQLCVISLDAFPAELTEAFEIRFVPDGTEAEEPDPDSPDEIPHDGEAIDLGEATAEQLALALDPYPRKPGAELPQEATPPGENPFVRLASLPLASPPLAPPPLASTKRKN